MFRGFPPPPHDYRYHWVILDPKSKEDKVKTTNLKNLPKFQMFEFWNNHYTRHTFWSCLIRCANMKWIRWVLLKIQSGHNSLLRWTEGQGETSIPPFQLRWSGGNNNQNPVLGSTTGRPAQGCNYCNYHHDIWFSCRKTEDHSWGAMHLT